MACCRDIQSQVCNGVTVYLSVYIYVRNLFMVYKYVVSTIAFLWRENMLVSRTLSVPKRKQNCERQREAIVYVCNREKANQNCGFQIEYA